MGFMGSDTHAVPAFLPVAPWHRSSQTQTPFLEMQTAAGEGGGGCQDEHFQSSRGTPAEGWCMDDARTCRESVPPPRQQHKIYVKQQAQTGTISCLWCPIPRGLGVRVPQDGYEIFPATCGSPGPCCTRTCLCAANFPSPRRLSFELGPSRSQVQPSSRTSGASPPVVASSPPAPVPWLPLPPSVSFLRGPAQAVSPNTNTWFLCSAAGKIPPSLASCGALGEKWLFPRLQPPHCSAWTLPVHCLIDLNDCLFQRQGRRRRSPTS